MQEEHQTNYSYKNMSGEREVMEDSIKESGQDMLNRLLKKNQRGGREQKRLRAWKSSNDCRHV